MADQHRSYEYSVSLPIRSTSRQPGGRVIPALKVKRWAVACASLALGLGLILAGVLIVPGVQVNGVDLRGLMLQQVQRRLETGWRTAELKSY